MAAGQQRVGLVLSGGGTRGAYEAGVMQGIVEVLDRPVDAPAPIQVFTGTSVGAINASFLASNAHRADLGVADLVSLWTSLDLRTHAGVSRRPWATRAMLSSDGIERLVRDRIDWPRLGRLVDDGHVHALLVAALHVGSGRTVVFADLAPGVRYRPSRDPRRVGLATRLTAEHVLASAAIPGMFKPREIEGRLFYDGGLRFNTPISPAIRCGARKLLIVSPLHQETVLPKVEHITDLGPDLTRGAPTPSFLAGKMLHAVLLDPVGYDVSVLERFNTLLDVLEQTLDADELRRLAEATSALRGQPYRKVSALVLSPSEDLGRLGWEHARAHRKRFLGEGPVGWMVASMAGGDVDAPSDLVSYLLFDGAFAEKLIALGRRDALARADEVRAFFDQGQA